MSNEQVTEVLEIKRVYSTKATEGVIYPAT